MWAVPSDEHRTRSLWTDGASNRPAVGTLAEAIALNASPDTVVRQGRVSNLVDPPILYDKDPDRERAQDDARPEPPSRGVRQQGTTVQVVKDQGGYFLVADGVIVPGKPDGERWYHTKHWLPRFRDVRNSEGARTVGPLNIGMRLEEGETPPKAVRVVVNQRIVDQGTVLREYEPVLDEELPWHQAAKDRDAPYTLLPYPAYVSRPPTATIVDMDARRRWEFARRKWSAGRTISVVRNIAKLYRLATGAASQRNDYLKDVENALNDESPARVMWRALLPRVSPTINQLVNTVSAFSEVALFGYESVKEAPTQLRSYDFSIPALIAALRRIAGTRNDGTTPERRWGLNPVELTNEGYRAEAALLYYLVYGSTSVLSEADARAVGAPEAEGDAAAPQGLISRLLPGWPDWLRWNTKSLTGNLLNPSGLDVVNVMQTRVEYNVEVHVTDDNLPGGERVFALQSLRANALDAGMIYAGLEDQVTELESAMRAVRERLRSMQSYGINWIHHRLHVADQRDGSVWGWGNLWASLSGIKDTEKRRQWAELSRAQRSQSLAGLRTPLVIDVNAFELRMYRMLYGYRVTAEGTLTDEESDDARFARRAKGVLLAADPTSAGSGGSGGSDGGGPLDESPEVVGLAEGDFKRKLSQLAELHRRSLGLSQAAYRGMSKTRAFWRWVDMHIPSLGVRDDERLSGFVVPDTTAAEARREPPMLVRRMPQLGTVSSKRFAAFGIASLLKVLDVPSDPLSNRKYAKAAVEAAKSCWSRSAEYYNTLRWVVEPTGPAGDAGGPLGFHFLQCYDITPSERNFLFDKLSPLRPAQASLNLLALTGCQPMSVTSGEALANAYGTVDDNWAASVVSGMQRSGDAALMRRFGVVESRVGILATHVYASVVAIIAVQQAASDRGVSLALVESAIAKAREALLMIADQIEFLYGAKSKRNELIGADDFYFGCSKGGDLTRTVLYHLDHWRVAQTQLRRKSPSVFQKTGTLWSAADKERITEFATALRRLATATAPPTDLPVMPMQSLWVINNPRVRYLQTFSVAAKGKTGVQLQLAEAIASFQRVRALLGTADAAQTPLSRAALECVVATRPVLLVVREEEGYESLAIDVLSSTGDLGITVGTAPPTLYTWEVWPPVDERMLALLKSRAAMHRLDVLPPTRTDSSPTSPKSPLDDLLLRFSSVKLDNASDPPARFLIAPGTPIGPAAFTTTALDLSHTSALEDAHLYPDVVQNSLTLSDPATAAYGRGAILVKAAGLTDANGQTRHPHLIEGGERGGVREWEIHLHQVAPLPKSLTDSVSKAVAPLATSALQLLNDMEREARAAPTRRSQTWKMHDRVRSMMWNTDRVMQVILLMETAHLEDRTSNTLLVLDDSWGPSAVVHLAAAIAMGHAVATERLRAIPKHHIRLSSLKPPVLRQVRAAMKVVAAAFERSTGPTALNEACLAVVAILP